MTFVSDHDNYLSEDNNNNTELFFVILVLNLNTGPFDRRVFLLQFSKQRTTVINFDNFPFSLADPGGVRLGTCAPSWSKFFYF